MNLRHFNARAFAPNKIKVGNRQIVSGIFFPCVTEFILPLILPFFEIETTYTSRVSSNMNLTSSTIFFENLHYKVHSPMRGKNSRVCFARALDQSDFVIFIARVNLKIIP